MPARSWLCALLFLLLTPLAAAAGLRDGERLPLWGQTLPPGSAAQASPPPNTSAPVGNELHNNIAGITQPTLSAFVPPHPNGISMIVVPGGSYTKLVAAKEGADIARWLNSLGITAFVLLHRLPNEGHANGRQVVLQDGQRAIRLLRQRAAEWKLDPARIGIMGFSAGGHLAAATGTAFGTVSYAPRDAADTLSPRPDFMALIYPAVGFTPRPDAGGLTENRAAFLEHATDAVPPANTPPAFIAIAADDSLVRSTVRFWQAMAQAGNPPELFIAAKGGHGFALKPDADPAVRVWPQLFATWLQTQGFIAR